MTKSQLRQLEDLKFEIEKAKLELELQSIRKQLSAPPIQLDIPSFVRQGSVLSPRHDEVVETIETPEDRIAKYDLQDPSQRVQYYSAELDISQSKLKESTDRIAELQRQKRASKSKEEKSKLQVLIDEGIKENINIQNEIKMIKKCRNQAMEAAQSKPF